VREQAAANRYLVRSIAEATGVAFHELRPETGRTHQLRVHAAAHGAPLLGDVSYGGPRRVVLGDGRVITPRRVMLHCAFVRIDGIGEGIGRGFVCDPPEDFAETWHAVGGDDSSLGCSP
jgi:23S rRNA-/tRNA-specific pseudouridylate synthase